MAHKNLTSGLQAHSIGGFYPWYRVHRGNDRAQWYNGETGELAGPWVSLSELSKTPPPVSAGPWIVRFKLAGVSRGYCASAYNVETQETRGWHNGEDYFKVLSDACRDTPAAVSAASDQFRWSGPLTEVSFLVPYGRDDNRQPHSPEVWANLETRLVDQFGGFSHTGPIIGTWRSDSGELIRDSSRQYTVAIDRTNNGTAESLLEDFIPQVCRDFGQQCIYTSVRGIARLVYA